MIINKKEKKLLEIGYKDKHGQEVYYADKDARTDITELKKRVINLNTEQASLLNQMNTLNTKVNNLANDLTGGAVPKDLNKLTNEVKSEQINMKDKDLYLYVNDNRDNENKPSKVSVIELGKIHNKLTPLVRTVDTDTAFNIIKDDLQDGEYIYKSAEIQER